MNTFITLLILILIVVSITKISMTNVSCKENFGALQSLYSNDGIQDYYLTLENATPAMFDPYKYWRGVPWDLPTRNLNNLVFYPYLYEYQIDRYGKLYPYW